jgi:hypothetical protein
MGIIIIIICKNVNGKKKVQIRNVFSEAWLRNIVSEISVNLYVGKSETQTGAY